MADLVSSYAVRERKVPRVNVGTWSEPRELRRQAEFGMFYRARPSAKASADRAARSVTVEPMVVTAGRSQASCCSWDQSQCRCTADLCAVGELLICSQSAGVLAEKVVHRR